MSNVIICTDNIGERYIHYIENPRPINSVHDTSEPDASAIEIFQIPENHVYATSSILSKCAVDTGFFPHETLDIPHEVFEAYIKRVSTFPGWSLVFNETSINTIEKNNAELMISQLQATYRKVAEIELTKLTISVARMIDSINNVSSSEKTLTRFLQVSIYNPKEDTNNISILICHISLTLEKKEAGKKAIEKQEYTTNMTKFTINTESLVRNAETLAKQIAKKNYYDWFQSLSSQTGDGSTSNCLRK